MCVGTLGMVCYQLDCRSVFLLSVRLGARAFQQGEQGSTPGSQAHRDLHVWELRPLTLEP